MNNLIRYSRLLRCGTWRGTINAQIVQTSAIVCILYVNNEVKLREQTKKKLKTGSRIVWVCTLWLQGFVRERERREAHGIEGSFLVAVTLVHLSTNNKKKTFKRGWNACQTPAVEEGNVEKNTRQTGVTCIQNSKVMARNRRIHFLPSWQRTIIISKRKSHPFCSATHTIVKKLLIKCNRCSFIGPTAPPRFSCDISPIARLHIKETN